MSFSLSGGVFGIEVGVGIVRKEAGAGEVFAGAVRFDAVGLLDVVGYAAEVVGVGQAVFGDGDDPFEAVAGGAAEQQFRLEVFVLQ